MSIQASRVFLRGETTVDGDGDDAWKEESDIYLLILILKLIFVIARMLKRNKLVKIK